MTILLTGGDLTRGDLVAVARRGETVEIAAIATDRMAATRAVLESVLDEGGPVYGSSTAVGVLKRAAVERAAAAAYSSRVLRTHRVAQGPVATREQDRKSVV